MTPPLPGRYARHLALPGFGPQGQLAVEQASFEVVGTGPAAATAAAYLVAAGVGACFTDALDPVDAAALDPAPRVAPRRAAPSGTLRIDPSTTEADGETLPELLGAVAAAEALCGVLGVEPEGLA